MQRGLLRLALALFFGLCRIPEAQALSPVAADDWTTIRTPNFSIHYQTDGLEAASAVASIAEHIRTYVMAQLDWDPGHLHVLIDSRTDLTNGLSTPVPYNQIRLYSYPPDTASQLHSYRDWIENLFLHEYVHAVHIDMAFGPTRYLRYVFGRQPQYVLGWLPTRPAAINSGTSIPLLPFASAVPNALFPSWVKEGLATYFESYATGRGRLFSAHGRAIVREAAGTGQVGNWSNLSSYGMRRWPRGSGPYQVGAAFLDALPREEVLAWQRINAWGFAPFLGWVPFHIATGQSLGASWRQFLQQQQAYLRAAGSKPLANWHRLDGQAHTGHLTSDGESAFWIRDNGDAVPVVMRWQKGLDAPERVTRIRGAASLAANSEYLVAGVYKYQDRFTLRWHLLAYDRQRGSHTVLAGTESFVEPALGPNRKIAAIRRQGVHSALWIGTISADGTAVDWQNELTSATGHGSLHTPAWSGDGSRLAYVQHDRESGHDTWTYEISSGTHSRLMASAREDLHPYWFDNGFWVASSRSGTFELYSLDNSTGTAIQQGRSGNGIWRPVQAGNTVLAEKYSRDGHSIVWSETLPSLQQPDPAPPLPAAELDFLAPDYRGSVTYPSGAYRVGTSILPRAWTPLFSIQTGSRPYVQGLGFLTSGVDVTGRHAWEAGFMSSLDSFRPLARLAYTVSTKPFDLVTEIELGAPGLTLNGVYFDTKALYGVLLAQYNKPGRLRRWGLSAGVSSHWYPDTTTAAWFDTSGRDLTGPFFGIEAGPVAGFSWNNYSSTPLVPGPHHGFGFELLGRLHATRTLDNNIGMVAAAMLHAHTAWRLFHHNLLEIEGWVGRSAGSALRQRTFSLQGTTLSSGAASAHIYNINLLSPLANATNGASVLAGRILFTQPIWYIDRGLGYVPLYFRSLYWRTWLELASTNAGAWSTPLLYDLPPTLGTEVAISAVLLDSIPIWAAAGPYIRFGPGPNTVGVALRLSIGF